ncbi:transposase [Mucilaginibacter mali]|uniref:Transposase n=1 Tax=Mucilaginibacter mali TaxID=2740462 RepID=A0A7D4UEA4_9SPHI|nr:transposase [Mucilaginibacter mali]QKJ31439.1 transposase [Mucilaginibacter mali]
MSRTAPTDELYFVTLTITNWIDLFTRRIYSNLIIENLAYCQKNKKLNIYAYVLMTNHLHIVANVEDGRLGDVLRDFKTYTSKQLFKLIEDNLQESRRDWLLRSFEWAGANNPRNAHHQLWQNGNHPVLLYSADVIQQKIDYIHNNPVKAGFVGSAHEYWYSSANPDSPLKIIV